MFYNHIFFDLDGTLADSKEGITNSISSALAHYGITADDALLSKCIGPPLRESFTRFFNFTEDDVDEVIRLFRKYYAESGVFESSLYDGVREMLEALRAEGKELILATSKEEDFARQILDNFKITHLFSFVSGADLDSGRLSKGAVLRHVLDNHKIESLNRCVMVGDREHDVDGAHKIGITCASVLYGYGSKQELQEAGADFFIDSVDELKAWLTR